MALLGCLVGIGRVAVVVRTVLLSSKILLFIGMGRNSLGRSRLDVAAGKAVSVVNLQGLKVSHEFIAKALPHLGPVN